MSASEDGEIIIHTEVDTTTANGYVAASVTIPNPGSTDRACTVQMIRDGANALDTCLGDAYLIGSLLTYTPLTQ